MKVVDSGHVYELDSLDGKQPNRLVFVKRVGEKYPGNLFAHAGTTTQEVLRACVDRLAHVYLQSPCPETDRAGELLVEAIWVLEARAARLHGRAAPNPEQALVGRKCKGCGHVGCPGTCGRVTNESENTE